MQIPNFIPPATDEHLLSWLFALAKVNLLPLDSLISNYVFGRSELPIQHHAIPFNASGLSFPLKTLWDFLPANAFSSFTAFIRGVTLFNAIEPAISEEEGQKVFTFLNSSDFRESNFFPGNSKPKYCPACIQEDYTNAGRVYIHRSHQVAGVAVCHLHGCRLGYMRQGLFCPNDCTAPTLHIPSQNPLRNELAYAKFIYNLLQHGIDSSGEFIESFCKSIICSLEKNAFVPKIRSDESVRSYLDTAYKDMQFSTLIPPHSNNYAFSGKYTPSCLARLLFLTGNFDLLSRAICEYKKNNTISRTTSFCIYLHMLVGDEYTAVNSIYPSSIGEDAIKLWHRDCNHVHRYSIDDFLHGKRCSCQRKLTERNFLALVKYLSRNSCSFSPAPNGRYKVAYPSQVRFSSGIYMEPEFIMQELKRPTLSPFFRLETKCRNFLPL